MRLFAVCSAVITLWMRPGVEICEQHNCTIPHICHILCCVNIMDMSIKFLSYPGNLEQIYLNDDEGGGYKCRIACSSLK